MPINDRDERGKIYPALGASLREIAKHYFFDVMAAEDENMGCDVYDVEEGVHPLFCCQWNNRPLCGECASIQHRIEDYAIDCMNAIIRAQKEVTEDAH